MVRFIAIAFPFPPHCVIYASQPTNHICPQQSYRKFSGKRKISSLRFLQNCFC